jgi:hypothetical protein
MLNFDANAATNPSFPGGYKPKDPAPAARLYQCALGRICCCLDQNQSNDPYSFFVINQD